MAAECKGSSGLYIGGGDGHGEMRVIHVCGGARRAVPEHSGAGKEAAASHCDIDIPAAASDGVVIGVADGRRLVGRSLRGKNEWTADEEDLRLRIRGGGVGDDVGQPVLSPASTGDIAGFVAGKRYLLFQGEMLGIKPLDIEIAIELARPAAGALRGVDAAEDDRLGRSM